MLISCPIVRIGEPKGWPVLTSFEEDIKLLSEFRFTSKKLDESIGIVRSVEAIMPCITLDVIVGKYINSLFVGNFLEGSVFVPGLKKFCFGVPNIFVKF